MLPADTGRTGVVSSTPTILTFPLESATNTPSTICVHDNATTVALCCVTATCSYKHPGVRGRVVWSGEGWVVVAAGPPVGRGGVVGCMRSGCTHAYNTQHARTVHEYNEYEDGVLKLYRGAESSQPITNKQSNKE